MPIVNDIHVEQAKYHSLGTSPYGKNLTLVSVSNKGFAHRLARLVIK
jgi:hypothetical protein